METDIEYVRLSLYRSIRVLIQPSYVGKEYQEPLKGFYVYLTRKRHDTGFVFTTLEHIKDIAQSGKG